MVDLRNNHSHLRGILMDNLVWQALATWTIVGTMLAARMAAHGPDDWDDLTKTEKGRFLLYVGPVWWAVGLVVVLLRGRL